jgi:hypothetical protein
MEINCKHMEGREGDVAAAASVVAAARELTWKKYLPRKLHFGVGKALGATKNRFGSLPRRCCGGLLARVRLQLSQARVR